MDSTTDDLDILTMIVSEGELVVDKPDLALGQLLRDLSVLGSQLQACSHRIASSASLKLQEYKILVAIEHRQNEDGFGIIQVADYLHVTGAFVTTEVNKLVEAGLVCKTSNPADGRRILLRVLPKGQELLQSLAVIRNASNDMVFTNFSQSDFLVLRVMVTRLLEATGRALKLINFMTSHDVGKAG